VISCTLHTHPLHITLSHRWQQKSSNNTTERHVRGKIINFTCQYGTSLFDMMCMEHPDQCCIVKLIYRYMILLWGKMLSQIKILLRNYWPTAYHMQTENSFFFFIIIKHITELCKQYMHNGYRFATIIWCKSLFSLCPASLIQSEETVHTMIINALWKTSNWYFSVSFFFLTYADHKTSSYTLKK